MTDEPAITYLIAVKTGKISMYIEKRKREKRQTSARPLISCYFHHPPPLKTQEHTKKNTDNDTNIAKSTHRFSVTANTYTLVRHERTVNKRGVYRGGGGRGLHHKRQSHSREDGQTRAKRHKLYEYYLSTHLQCVRRGLRWEWQRGGHATIIQSDTDCTWISQKEN